MTNTTLWGTINADGSISNSSGGFSVTHQNTGEYIISFSPPFGAGPAIVGSQVNYGNTDESAADNIVFPFLSNSEATAITGDGGGTHTDRSFSFVAVGSQ